MNKVVIIQARMGSTRFPGKVLQKLKDKMILQWVVDRARRIALVDKVVVATSTESQDDAIYDYCKNNQIDCFRGNESDVLARYYETAVAYKADIIMRITSDCPLLDPALASQVLHLVVTGSADYASNVLPATWPDGLDCEVFTMAALTKAHQHATRPSDREHVTPYIRNNQYKFRVKNVPSVGVNLSDHRWTVDSPADLAYISDIVAHCGSEPSTWDVLAVLAAHPEIKRPEEKRNEGFAKSLKEETTFNTDFSTSNDLLKRALKTIPLGSQTFSKSYIQYPEGTSPMFLTHGVGGRVWDVDGNEYVDLVSGLLPVVLGYNDPDVNEAIQDQLSRGISFSLATDLEFILAEKICKLIPSAEKIRFAKNGTDVTSAAIRLSRAYTGRERIITCGYHGWQDWYIGTTTRNKGVPKAVSELTSVVPYNDLEKAEDLLKTEQYAAFIMEPCNVAAPQPGYLQGLKDLCEKYGTVFVFDEVVTGFRFANGGAQEYFGVTPHLSCFGKAMGNGMPISAIVGQDHIMKEMEEIFFSGTFGGEALSLAASIATIDKIVRDNVVDQLWSYGAEVGTQAQAILKSYDLDHVIGIMGLAPWLILAYKDYGKYSGFDIKTLFVEEMLKRGILINGSFNVNFGHTVVDQIKVLDAFRDVCGIIADAVHQDRLFEILKTPSIKPLFKVR
jgi:glutamate-1-semialdehyde aminotransferase/spore coat polysaccharide biosynthesis protein SpsF (cytidylyltransferase family)